MSDIRQGITSQNGEDIRQKILASALDVCRSNGYQKTTVEAIAAGAGVAVDVVTAAWPSKAAVVIDAFRRSVGAEFLILDSGDFKSDLIAQLVGVARIFADPEIAPHLTQVIGEAQYDGAVAEAFRERIFAPNRHVARKRFVSAQRSGQIRADIDLDAAIDLAFAPLWFRLLLPTGTVGKGYAEAIAELALSGLRPS